VRILIEAHHPSDIHFFKHAVKEWAERGNDVLLLGRDRDVMKALLAAYDFIPHRILTSERRDNRFPLAEMLERQVGVAQSIREFRPDVVMSLMGSYAQSAFLFRVPNLVFTDSEHQSFNHRIAHPFATRIYTPECFEKDLGKKQRRYRGYHELAFLHPKRFSPDSGVLSEIGVEARQYVVVRTSAWNTLHDIGKSGLGPRLEESVRELSKRARVLLVPEGGQLPASLESLRLRPPPDRYHHVLAFARLVLSEGASTASEAACLGVPTVYLNPSQLGYLRDQERRYGLVYNTTDSEAAMRRALALLDAPFDAEKQEAARKRLIDDHVDVTDYLVAEVDALGH
jgi:predicted glycosyltransferase